MFREGTLGVLLVYGIGEQPKGDTLLKFREPIIQWVEQAEALWSTNIGCSKNSRRQVDADRMISQ